MTGSTTGDDLASGKLLAVDEADGILDELQA